MGRRHEHIRRYLVLSCMALCYVTMTAHANTGEGITNSVGAGGKVGLNVSDFGGKDAGNESATSTSKLGAAGGIFAFVRVHDRIAVQLEMLYMSKGADAEVDQVNIGTVTMDYLDVPFLASIKILGNERIRVYGLLGPQVGVILRAKVEDNFGNSVNVKDRRKPLDFGAVLGLGMTWAITPGHGLCSELRYGYGLITVDDSENDFDVKNRAFTFMVGYQWGLGSR